ncbi:hypothetical protein [Nocardiopsis protaetiae]|uniref:hypothetical protein n=1 Tax=Nocardiopsis protaetiae TaxID=3382270 RepID=UPI00387B9D0B
MVPVAGQGGEVLQVRGAAVPGGAAVACGVLPQGRVDDLVLGVRPGELMASRSTSSSMSIRVGDMSASVPW